MKKQHGLLIIFVILIGCLSFQHDNYHATEIYYCIYRKNPLKSAINEAGYNLYNQYNTPFIYLNRSKKDLIIDVYNEMVYQEKDLKIENNTYLIKGENEGYKQINIFHDTIPLMLEDTTNYDFLAFSYFKTSVSSDEHEKWDIISTNLEDFFIKKNLKGREEFYRITLSPEEINNLIKLLNFSINNNISYLDGLSEANYYTLYLGKHGEPILVDVNITDSRLGITLKTVLILIKNIEFLGKLSDIHSDDFMKLYNSNKIPPDYRKLDNEDNGIIDLNLRI